MTHAHLEHSSVDSIKAAPGSAVAVVRNLVSGKNRDLVIGVFLALSVIVNIWLIFAYRDYRTQEWVNQYDLTFFKTNDYAALKAQVEAQEKLINAWGLRQAVQCPKEK